MPGVQRKEGAVQGIHLRAPCKGLCFCFGRSSCQPTGRKVSGGGCGLRCQPHVGGIGKGLSTNPPFIPPGASITPPFPNRLREFPQETSTIREPFGAVLQSRLGEVHSPRSGLKGRADFAQNPSRSSNPTKSLTREHDPGLFVPVGPEGSPPPEPEGKSTGWTRRSPGKGPAPEKPRRPEKQSPALSAPRT